jgi:hypothetical protein
MTAAAIKKDIHQLLLETEDTLLLEQIKAIFLHSRQETDEKLYFEGISIGENALIKQGLNDLQQGKIHTHENVRKHINQNFINK